ncbi:cation diffusion facilitator family transporter [Dethiothermospora halolimnae]|uniref:cation diffusion facilitator family transporter n=1 Tax=Dethiothermospora halolimnae TaxID=3114390 RepID=UPI003CCB7EC4
MNRINENERYKIGNKIAWITIIINIILSFLKVIVGIIGNSTAILADGIHTISDVISSLGIVIGFFISKKPADKEHPYGHEKAETIAGFVLSIFLTFVGLRIGYMSIKMIITNNIETPKSIAIWVAAMSIVIKEIQFRIAIYGGKKINSDALIADAWHHRSDALSSIGALIGIIGARMGYKILDPIAGIVVSFIIVKVGIELFIKGYNELMDMCIEDEKIDMLYEEIMSRDNIRSISQIKARKHGSKVFFEVKVCVDSNMTVAKGHDIAEEVERIIYGTIKDTKDVIVHINPCIDSKCKKCDNKL